MPSVGLEPEGGAQPLQREGSRRREGHSPEKNILKEQRLFC